MRVMLLGMLMIVSNGTAIAQPEIEYRFTASLESEEVYMRIVIKAGSTCNGIFIERSIDSVSFEQIGAIPGICGSSDADVPYNFTDAAPIANRKNHYRIRFGDNGFSEVLSVLYIQLSNHYKVFPNPVHTDVTLHFSNPSNAYYELTVSTANGNMVLKPGGTKSEMINFSVSSLLPGGYVFVLSSSDAPSITGRLVVD